MSLNPKTCSVRANLCKKIEVVRQLFKAFHEKERGHKVRIRTTEEPKEGRKREPEDTLAKTEFEEVEVAKRPAVSSVRKRSTLRWKQDPGTAIGKKEVVSLLDGKVMPVEDLVQHRDFRIARKIIDEVAKAKIIEKLLNEEDNATIRRLFETDLANPSFKEMKLLHRALSKLWEYLMCNLGQFHFEQETLVFLCEREKAKARFLDVLLFCPSTLPDCWGGRHICEVTECESGTLIVPVSTLPGGEVPRSAISETFPSQWSKLVRVVMDENKSKAPIPSEKHDNAMEQRKESFGTKIVRRKSPSSLIKPDHRGEQAKKEKKDVETSLKHSKKIISAKKGDLKDSAGAATEKKIGQKIDVSEKKDSKISAAASIDRKIERRDQKPSKDYDYINTKELEDYLCELGDTEGAENVVKKKENEEKKMIVRDPHCIEAIIETYSMGVKNRADSKKEAQTTLQMGSSHKASTQKVDTEGKDVLLKNLCKTQEEESQMQYKIDHIAKSEQMSAQMKSSNKVSTQKVETWGTDALLKDLCKTQDHEPHEEHRKRCKTDLKLKREQMAAQVESTNKPSAQKVDMGRKDALLTDLCVTQEDGPQKEHRMRHKTHPSPKKEQLAAQEDGPQKGHRMRHKTHPSPKKEQLAAQVKSSHKTSAQKVDMGRKDALLTDLCVTQEDGPQKEHRMRHKTHPSPEKEQSAVQVKSSHKTSAQKVDMGRKDALLTDLCVTQEDGPQKEHRMRHKTHPSPEKEQLAAQVKSSHKTSAQKVDMGRKDALLTDLCVTQEDGPQKEHRMRHKTHPSPEKEQLAAQVKSSHKTSAQKVVTKEKHVLLKELCKTQEDEGLRLSTTQKIRKSQEDSKLFFGKHVKEPRQEQQGGTFGMMKGKEAEVSGNSMEKTKSKEKHRHKEGEAHEGGERDVRSPETLGGKRTKKGGSLELKKHEEKHSLPQINREAYGRNIEDKKETSKGNDQYKKEKHLERKDEVKVAAVKKESEGAATLKNEEKTEQKVKERKNEEESKTTDTLLKIVGSVTAMLREMLVPTKRDQGKVETDPEISLQKTQTDDERFIQSVDQKGQDRKDLECRPYAMELANTQEEITDSNQDKKPAKGTKAKESNKRQVIDFLKKDVEGKNTTQASPGSGNQIKIKNMKSKERGNEQSGRTTRNRSRGKQTDAAEKTRDMKGTGRKEEVIAEVKQQSENVPNETLKADIMQRIRKSKDSMRKIHSKKEDDNKKLTKERKVDSKGPAATSGRDSRSRKKSIPNSTITDKTLKVLPYCNF
ncbi:hypothetical protein RB195_020973 [Necator americanus]|uniref:DUF7774 domain-containing protein n=1 Tax=Necator americanus TaxID=51031 RepID=A0ABR1CLI6_NECAM